MNINFRIDGQRIMRVDSERLAANSIGFLNAVFEFDSEWDSLTKKAVFDKGESSVCSILTGERCVIPHEVLGEGEFGVSVIGLDGDEAVRATSGRVQIYVHEGPDTEAENASEPTLSEMEQLTAIAGRAEQIANEVKQRLDSGEGGGGVSQERLEVAVSDYLTANPPELDSAQVADSVAVSLRTAENEGVIVSNYELAKSKTSRYLEAGNAVTADESTVDIALFAGQSNSCGRAEESDCTTARDLLITCPLSCGFSFNNTASTTPVKITEPISANNTMGYGYIPAFINAYHKTTGRKVCACYCSEGGVMLKKFLPYELDDETGEEKTTAIYQPKYEKMLNAVNHAKEKLASNGYSVGNIFLVWCQGESDAAYLGNENAYAGNYEKSLEDEDAIREYYKTKFTRLFEKLKEDTGLTTAFIIRIGHKKDGDAATIAKYANMIEAQNELCRENPDMVMVSALFAGAIAFIEEDGSERDLMRSDGSHYLPEGYLRAGLEAGINAGLYNRSGRTKKPVIFEYHSLYKEDDTLYERAVDKYLYDPYKNDKADLDYLSEFVSRDVESISLSAASGQLEVGKTLQLICSYSPPGSYGEVAYASNNTSVATVNDKGVVTGVSPGDVTINAILGLTDIHTSISLKVVEAQQGGEEGGDNEGSDTSEPVFDFDFTQNNLADYSLFEIFTIPEGSGDVSSIEYDTSKGMSLNGELPYGLVLNEPIDSSRAWTLEMTATFAPPMAVDGNRRAVLNGEATYPCLMMAFASSAVSSIAFMAGSSSSKKRTPQYVIADGTEHSYKITYNEDKILSFYVDGIFKKSFDGNSDSSFEGYTGSFTRILGLASGQSTAYIWQNLNTEGSAKSYLKKLKFTYGVLE